MTCKKLMHYSHGEVNFFQVNELPKGLIPISIESDFVIVGESETHGNDHRVAVLDKEKVKLYEKDGILYMQNTIPVDVYCPNIDRHSTIELPPSIWEIDKSKEYDYLTQELRNVKD